jgi:hypothetical protein
MTRASCRKRRSVSLVAQQLNVAGERHLWRTLTGYAQHYNHHRPHQSREQRRPLHEPGQTVDVTARIKRRQVVHGLISEYRRAA